MNSSEKEGTDKELMIEKARKKWNFSRWLFALFTIMAVAAIGLGYVVAFCGRNLPLVPLNYKLVLHPFLIPRNFTFVGKMALKMNVVRATKMIQLYARDLDIVSNTIRVAYSKVDDATEPDSETATDINVTNTITIKETVHVKAREYFVIHLDRDLIPGRIVEASLSFRGNLTHTNSGFYVRSFTQNGTTRWLAATRFQPRGARQAFPCMDDLEATFDITLVREWRATSLSNMPRDGGEIRGEGLAADIYQRTPPIPTHRVAFAICDFRAIGIEEFKLKLWPRLDRLPRHALASTPRIN